MNYHFFFLCVSMNHFVFDRLHTNLKLFSSQNKLNEQHLDPKLLESRPSLKWFVLCMPGYGLCPVQFGKYPTSLLSHPLRKGQFTNCLRCPYQRMLTELSRHFFAGQSAFPRGHWLLNLTFPTLCHTFPPQGVKHQTHYILKLCQHLSIGKVGQLVGHYSTTINQLLVFSRQSGWCLTK